MILAIDQGTTGSTCLVFDHEAQLVGRAYREFQQHFPRPGWVEHDAARDLGGDARRSPLEALADAGVAGRRARRRSASPTSARPSCVWDPATGEPLHRAIVWQDRRTADRCDELRAAGHEPLVRERTGPRPRPLLLGDEDRVAAARRRRARRARARRARGLRDDRLLAASGSSPASTRPTPRTPRGRCSSTCARGAWADELLRAVRRRPERALPRDRGPRWATLGSITDDALPGPARCRSRAIAGDQQAALFGQACLDPGMAKNTYGTGIVRARQHRRRGAAGARPGCSRPSPGGSAQRRDLRARGVDLRHRRRDPVAARRARDHRRTRARSEALAASLDGNDGVYFVPALTGLGSPHWDPYARGTIVGLTRGSGRAHLARAALEAIAYQTVDAVRAQSRPRPGEPLGGLKADGGATANAWLMQFQADVLGVPVVVPEVAETTALGAALPGRGRRRRLDRRRRWRSCGARRRATSRGWARTSARPCCTAGRGRSSARAAGWRPSRVSGGGDDGAATRRPSSGRSRSRSTRTRARPRRSSRYYAARADQAAGPAGSTRSSGSSPRCWPGSATARGRSTARTCPTSGPLIFAPNHFSNLDHFFMGQATRRKVQFMAKSQLFDGGPMSLRLHARRRLPGPPRPPRRAQRSRSSARSSGRDGTVCVYCEGGRSRTGKLAERAKPGIGRIALETGAPIVPVGDRRVAGVRATGSGCGFPRVTVQLRRADALGAGRRARRASSSRRSPTRSSPRSSACTRRSAP